jgi:hypothetical protein
MAVSSIPASIPSISLRSLYILQQNLLIVVLQHCRLQHGSSVNCTMAWSSVDLVGSVGLVGSVFFGGSVIYQ